MHIKSLTTQANQWEQIDSRVPPEYWPEYETMSLLAVVSHQIARRVLAFTTADVCLTIATAHVRQTCYFKRKPTINKQRKPQC